MHDLALYRKYRPENFKEVIEQGDVVSVLSSEIKSGNIAHSYLFAGSRGTGKTTVARIFAREIGASVNDIYEIETIYDSNLIIRILYYIFASFNLE